MENQVDTRTRGECVMLLTYCHVTVAVNRKRVERSKSKYRRSAYIAVSRSYVADPDFVTPFRKSTSLTESSFSLFC
jgi:hypothetical protein